MKFRNEKTRAGTNVQKNVKIKFLVALLDDIFISVAQIQRRKQSCQFTCEKCHPLLVDVNISTRNSSGTFRIKAICCFSSCFVAHLVYQFYIPAFNVKLLRKEKKVNTYCKRQIRMGWKTQRKNKKNFFENSNLFKFENISRLEKLFFDSF